MCGISGIVGKSNISKKLFHCIKNLEYRGYDSCGIAIITDEKIELRKNVGTIEEVNRIENLSEPIGSVGIAHTRWATHGKVDKVNAHPHISCDGNFALVHNGIISNYRILKEELQIAGYRFISDTDTEVIVHLIEHYYKSEKNVEAALLRSIEDIEGSYAILFISTHEPEKIFWARHESPLILGIGSDCMYIASDINAFIEFTRNTIILDNDEYGIISPNGYHIRNVFTKEDVEKDVMTIDWDAQMAKKGGYPDFMLKEIHEQPYAISNALNIDKEEVTQLARMIHDSSRAYLLGVGTAHYATLFGQYYFSMVADSFVPAISSDEFKHLAKIDENTLVIANSQSGETYDTLKALQFARSKGAKTAAIVNVIGSSMTREVDHVIMQNSGPEIAVNSTKATTSQMVIFIRAAIELAKLIGCRPTHEIEELEDQMLTIPKEIQKILNLQPGQIKRIADLYSPIKNWLFIARGIYLVVAKEGAHKFKEVTYLHGEAVGGGFMKHGEIALIDEHFGTIFFVPPEDTGELYSLTMGNVEEIKSRKGLIIGIHSGEENSIFDEEIIIHDAPFVVTPLLYLLVAQLFAYFMAIKLGRNADKPRNLAKSVTVA